MGAARIPTFLLYGDLFEKHGARTSNAHLFESLIKALSKRNT